MIKGHINLADLEPLHQDQHRILFSNCLGIIDKVTTTAPTRDTLPVGYCQVANISGARRLYFNLSNSIYYLEMTAV